jgi:hypothetical protein
MLSYKQLMKIGQRFLGLPTLFKYGYNWSPMYRRSTARIQSVSADLLTITIKLPISYKNRNYVGSIFGGSMFAAVDPIPMVQLMNLIGDDYVVWDKSAEIYFKRPAREDLYAEFNFTPEEVEKIKFQVAELNEIDIFKTTQLTNKHKTIVYCEVKKTIYIAEKEYHKAKRSKRKNASLKE